MTKEQAIEKIKWSIHINELTKDINGSNTSINVEVLKTVLSMLEEKDKTISSKDKIIDLMAEKIYEEGIVWDNKEEVKQYFENKAKELLNK